MSLKRARSPSPPAVRPSRAGKRPEAVDDFHEFTRDLQDTVSRMLPTGGRRYDQAAVLAIDFSISDIPSIKPLRDELLQLLDKQYNWTVETFTIDCSEFWRTALSNLERAVRDFTFKHASRGQTRSLLTFYFSGHGFADKSQYLNLCGSYSRSRGKTPTPAAPWLPWNSVPIITGSPFSDPKNNHQLVIMDCCAAGLANLDENEVEVLGASAWESGAASSSQSSFTRALIDELKILNGKSVTTTQLVSALHSRNAVKTRASMPVHKRPKSDQEPALFHRIETTPAPPSPQVKTVPRHAHVFLAIKVKKEDTIPNTKQWAYWLKTNLPSYIGEIDITAKWTTGSALVVVVMPIEIWLDLPAREGYIFIDYNRAWDARNARQRLEVALASPPQPQQEQVPRQPQMRSGNIQQPPGSSSTGRK